MQPVRIGLSVRYPASIRSEGKTAHRYVSGRMLLLRRLRHGVSGKRGCQTGASADEPGKVCAGERGAVTNQKMDLAHLQYVYTVGVHGSSFYL